MPTLVFYRQKRYDQAMRTGIELDDQTIAEQYEEGDTEVDPALLWYVDLKGEGDGLPACPDEAVNWLLTHAAIIREGFSRFAEKLRAGTDPDIYSLIWEEFTGLPANVNLMIACSATRRVDAREMASTLRELAKDWVEILRKLDVTHEVGG